MGGRKKKSHRVIVSCDPSFKGCAFVLWAKAYDNFSKAQVYDIRGERKRFGDFLYQVAQVNALLDHLFVDFSPYIMECSVFVIEGQFKPKMRTLLHAIVNQFYTRIPKANDLKIFVVSALSWRPFYGLSPKGSTYDKRKKLSIEYVRSNPQLNCSELWSKDDNICEAILLLNFVLYKHGLLIADTMGIRLWLGDTHHDFDDNEIKKKCPDCKDDKKLSIRLSSKQESRGMPYFHCKGCQDKDPKKGYKGEITNKSWLKLIRAAQKEANYLVDESEEEEEPRLTKRQARKENALAKLKKKDDNDDDSSLLSVVLKQATAISKLTEENENLSHRLYQIERLLATVNARLSLLDSSDESTVTPLKKRKLNEPNANRFRPTATNVGSFGDRERALNDKALKKYQQETQNYGGFIENDDDIYDYDEEGAPAQA